MSALTAEKKKGAGEMSALYSTFTLREKYKKGCIIGERGGVVGEWKK
jgi:hypothetical protein